MRKIAYITVMFCISCSVGEDYVAQKSYSDATLAQTLNISAEKPLPQKWYADFADPELTTLVEQGLKNNTNIKTAALRIKQARAQLQITKVAALPQINAQSEYNYEKQSRNIGPAALNSHHYSAGFDASWELDLWGKNRRQIEAGKASLNAAKYTLENVKIVVAAEIIANYINLRQNAENLRLAEKNARLQQEILTTVKAKYDNGLADETAYNEAQYLLENTRAQIPQYRAAIEQYRNALATLLGILPAELPLKDNKFTPLSTARTAHLNLREFPASVVRMRPDVAAAEQNLIAKNALVGAAVAELYPNISLSGLWGYASQGGSHLFNSSSQTYNYAPLLSLPLLDWNRLQNNVQLQKYIEAEALTSYKQTVLDAVTEIKNAQTAYAENRSALQNKARALQNMRKTAQLTQKKYENGLIEFSEVVRTQQNLISADQDYVAINALILQNIIAFYKAVAAPIY